MIKEENSLSLYNELLEDSHPNEHLKGLLSSIDIDG